ncbi:MAG: hypothetical protein NCA08_06870 [Deltaproteobacteria bacterium]|nr:hypothetical protein [Candidatus Deferrimicrobium borealis]
MIDRLKEYRTIAVSLRCNAVQNGFHDDPPSTRLMARSAISLKEAAHEKGFGRTG